MWREQHHAWPFLVALCGGDQIAEPICSKKRARPLRPSALRRTHCTHHASPPPWPKAAAQRSPFDMKAPHGQCEDRRWKGSSGLLYRCMDAISIFLFTDAVFPVNQLRHDRFTATTTWTAPAGTLWSVAGALAWPSHAAGGKAVTTYLGKERLQGTIVAGKFSRRSSVGSVKVYFRAKKKNMTHWPMAIPQQRDWNISRRFMVLLRGGLGER